MALETKELLQLMKLAASADKSSPVAYSFGDESFTYSEINEALRQELNELAGDYASYRRNKNTIFELIEATIDEILPPRVDQQYGQFAEVRNFAQGDKPVFSIRITNASRLRAKQFVTKVGLAGVYEVFRLDGKSVTVDITAYGGAAYITLEEFLDGRITFADVLDVVMLALDEAIYSEIATALVATVSSLPNPNKYAGAGFVEAEMDQLIAIAGLYGAPTIYCTYEFATQMMPASGSTYRWSDRMADELWNTGMLGNYKGTRVVVLPQSITDSTPGVSGYYKVIDPSYAWIIPAGANKPVKVAFEGQTITQEFSNRDGSREIQIYKKLGIATLVTNNICSYQNTGISRYWA